MVRITVEAVELGFALAEIDIDTGLRKTVVALDSATQLHGIDADLASELLKLYRALMR